LGLSKPLPLQYLNYLGSLLRLDWEFNYRPGSRRLVSDQQYFPATVELAAFSMAVALIIGIGVAHRDQARFSI